MQSEVEQAQLLVHNRGMDLASTIIKSTLFSPTKAPIQITVNSPFTMAVPNHLIIVCCHGIWTGGPSNGANEDEWLIADFQRGETDTFIEHIKAGVRCLAQDYDNSVLVFSG